jgi:hypothetical protein
MDKPKCVCQHCGPYSHPECTNREHRQQAWLEFRGGIKPSPHERRELAKYVHESWKRVSKFDYRNQDES